MNPLIPIVVIGVIPLLLVLIFRVKASMLFMTLCAGSVLSRFTNDDALKFMSAFFKNYSQTSQSAIAIGLIAVPPVLTAIFMRKQVSFTSILAHIVPALLAGVVAVLLVVPLLPGGTRNDIFSSNVWSQITQYQAVLVGAAVLVNLLLLWMGSKGHKKGKGRGKHGK